MGLPAYIHCAENNAWWSILEVAGPIYLLAPADAEGGVDSKPNTDEFFAAVAEKSHGAALRGDYAKADADYVVEQDWHAYTPPTSSIYALRKTTQHRSDTRRHAFILRI